MVIRASIRRLVLSIGVVVAAGCQAAAPSAAPLTPFALQLDFLPGGAVAGFYYALDQGYYRAEGLDVSIAPGRGSGDTVNRIAAGQSDVGYADLSAVVGASTNAVAKVIAIGALLRRPPHSLMLRADSGIETPADLAGKNIGTSPGNAVEILFPFFAENADLDAASVSFTSMDPGALGPALLSNQVDAACLFAFNLATVQPSAAEQGIELRQFNFSDYELEVNANSIIANTDKVASDPEWLRAFLRATYKAYEEIFTGTDKWDAAAAAMVKLNPDASAAIFRHGIEIAEHYILTPELEDGSVSWGEFEPGRVTETRDLYVEALDLATSVPIESLFTNSLVP